MYHSYQPYLESKPQAHNYFSSYANLKTLYSPSSKIIYSTVPRRKSFIYDKPIVYYEDYESDLETDHIGTDEEGLSTSEEYETRKHGKNVDLFDDPNFDSTLENLIYQIDNQKFGQTALKRIERNQTCLSMLIEGDLIEYVRDESDLESQYNVKWALYMGNSKIMRFDAKKRAIVYESYWKIAKSHYIFINKDLERRLIALPIYETLKKARKAYENQRKYSRMFSSEKNFCMWCRFNINKSDIDFATDSKDGEKFSSDESKDFLLEKFFSSLDLAKK